jgi:hypothetical protein
MLIRALAIISIGNKIGYQFIISIVLSLGSMEISVCVIVSCASSFTSPALLVTSTVGNPHNSEVDKLIY